jgi:drug/metabolite transporter (DMT)-like permease
MPRTQANICLLLAGAIWGMGFVAQTTAMSNIGPFLFIGLRFLTAALAMAPFAWAEHRRAKALLGPRDFAAFAVVGMLLFLGMAAQQNGLLTTSVTNSGFLTGLYVVMVPVLLVVLFRRPPHPVVWPAAVLALGGIFLLSGGRIEALRTGDWLTILCAFFWALQVIAIGRLATDSRRPVTLAVTQFAVCAVVALAVAFVNEPVSLPAISAAMPEILFAGVFSGGIAFTLQAVAQSHTTPAQAAIFLSSEALFAALFGALLLGERMAPIGLVGCGLIFVAMLVTEIIPALFPASARSNALP